MAPWPRVGYKDGSREQRCVVEGVVFITFPFWFDSRVYKRERLLLRFHLAQLLDKPLGLYSYTLTLCSITLSRLIRLALVTPSCLI